MSLFEHTVEHLMEEFEFLDDEISLSKALNYLARRYTAHSI